MLQRVDVVFVAPTVVAVLLAVVLLPKRSAQVVGAMLVGVLTLASVGFEELLARAQGTTLDRRDRAADAARGRAR